MWSEASGKQALPRSCQVRILNHITWKKVAQLEHPSSINNTKAVSVFCSCWALQMWRLIHRLLFCVFRLCIKKWSEGQRWVLKTCLCRTSPLAPPSLILRANVRPDMSVFLIRWWTLVCCGCLLQMRLAHCQSKFLWSNQIRNEPTPRSAFLLWHSAQTVAI